MLSAPVLPARVPRPITDERLAQAYAAEELLETLLNDLHQDMQNGAAMLACDYQIPERFRPHRSLARTMGRGPRSKILQFPHIRDPEPITDARLEGVFAAERLLDAILDDLFEDLVSGAAVVSRSYQFRWLHKRRDAIRLTRCATG
jgi:hypothetical protein